MSKSSNFPLKSVWTKLAAILLGPLAVGMCQGALTYTTATFDVAGFVGSTTLNGVNNLGDMVGVVGLDNPEGFIQLHSGQLTLFAVPGAFETVPTGINDNGVVVGWYALSVNNDVPVGFIRQTDGTFTSYQAPHSTGTQLRGINDHGEVIGVATSGSSAAAFILDTSTGGLTSFSVGSSSNTQAYGINNSGTVTGSYQPRLNFTRPYIRSSDGTVQLFGVISQQNSQTAAACINDSGAVAGWYYLASTGQYTNYVRAQSGAVIATFQDGTGSSIAGMNDSFVVVGTFSDETGEHAFIGTPTQMAKALE